MPSIDEHTSTPAVPPEEITAAVLRLLGGVSSPPASLRLARSRPLSMGGALLLMAGVLLFVIPYNLALLPWCAHACMHCGHVIPYHLALLPC